jgi:hypothetical protein
MTDKIRYSIRLLLNALIARSNYLQSPHLFICVDLCHAGDSGTSVPGPINNRDALAGTSVSSLYRLKDIDNSGTRIITMS